LRGANKLRFRLIRDGYKATDVIVVLYACSEPSLRELKQKVKLDSDVNVIISLACSAGWACITRAFPDKKVINATEDVGLMVIDTDEGMFKITAPYRKYKRQIGSEYKVGTGEPILEEKIMLEVRR